MIGGTIDYLPLESLQKRSATAKSDVFSFGIVVLEVVSGRRAVDLAYPDEEIVLLDWVRKLSDEGKMLQAGDGRLPDGSYSLSDMQRLSHLGLLCSLNDPQLRPTMKWGIEYAFSKIEYMSLEKRRETGQISCDGWSCAWKKEKVAIYGAYESLRLIWNISDTQKKD
ncbi:Receptor like protein kinase S.2 [Asimina triloba]